MRIKYIVELLCVVFMLSAVSVSADQKEQRASSDSFPAAIVKQPRYNFQSVVEGTVVTHAFIIENKGKAPLHIKKVKTSCGCTTADYSKVIEPGKEGNVTIKGNTRGYGGRTFSKTIMVHTDDPKNQQLNLYIKGEVDVFASIKPRRVFLSGTAEDDIQSTVTIIPAKKYAFHIKDSSVDQSLGQKVSFELADKKDRYILSVTNLLKEPGSYRGKISLKTDSTIVPEILIHVYGVIKAKKI